MPSSAVKTSSPLRFTGLSGYEPTSGVVLISLTSTVPPSVPSLFHSSTFPVSSSSAAKRSVPLTSAREVGRVGKLRTSCAPVDISSARERDWIVVKYSEVPTRVRSRMPALPPSTSTVPASVPSVFQSLVNSKMSSRRSATKKTLSPTGVSASRLSKNGSTVVRSFSRIVPAVVPSLFQSCAKMTKYRTPW